MPVWMRWLLMRMPLVWKPRDWLPSERPTHQKCFPHSTGNVTYEIEDPKLFTSGDMEKALQHALENKRKEMEASFAKLKASASESQTSSGAAPRSPHAAFLDPGTEAPLQRGSPYQW